MWFLITILFIWFVVLNIKLSDISKKINSLEKFEKHNANDIANLFHRLNNQKESKIQPTEQTIEPQIEIPPASYEEACEAEKTTPIDENSDTKGESLNTCNMSAKDIIELQNIKKELNIEVYDDEKTNSVLNNNANYKDVKSKSAKNLESKDKPFDFESAFLGNIFNKIGALAILIGIGIFIKIISSFIEFTPQLKITLSYIAGISIFGFGCTLKEAKMQAYKEVLLGLGVSIGFVATYCACALFELFSPTNSLIIATIILFIVYFIADKQKTNSMIAIALIGGYLNPLLITHSVNCEFLFGYYLVVNLLSCVYVFKNPNKSIINFVNLFLTFIVLATFIGVRDENVNIVYPVILWAIYLIYDIIRKNKKFPDTDPINLLNWLNFVILTIFSIKTFFNQKEYIGYLLLVAGVIYILLTFKNFFKQSENYKPYMFSTFVCVFLATFFLTDEILRVALWSAESVFLSAIAYKTNLKNVGNWAFAFLSASIVNLFFIKGVIYTDNIANYMPVWNTRGLGFIFPIISGVLSYKIFKNSNENNFNIIAQRFKFVFWSLIYLYATFEINNSVAKFAKTPTNKDFISRLLISIIGFGYSIQFKKFYNANKYKFFNFASCAIYILSGILLILTGITYKPIKSFSPVFNIRFVAFIFAILSSYIHSKLAKTTEFIYIAIGFGFLLLSFETQDYIKINTNIDWLLTVMWLTYAGIITIIGIFKNIKSLKNSGIWISIFAILRIFFFDLADTDMTYKLIAFITLGVILLIVSYFYNKKR